MPHSKFKNNVELSSDGLSICTCGKSFLGSDRDRNKNIQLHKKFCSNPLKAYKEFWIPKKAMTNNEVDLICREMKRKIRK